uniref:Uncharacterized protein n=1 Tax=Anguilla anguilla TaxID=7936 RepID=A0A0E9PWC3_ANGAN
MTICPLAFNRYDKHRHCLYSNLTELTNWVYEYEIHVRF